jgi:hypothetical protein
MLSNIKNLVEGAHPIYKNNVSFWDFLLQSYEGGVNYTSSLITGRGNNASTMNTLFNYYVNGVQQPQRETANGNLFMHPKETVEDYTRRLRMSYYYNFCAPIIDIYKNHLFKDSVNVEFGDLEDDVEPREQDIDNKGSSVHEFRRELAENTQLYGHVFVVVDMPVVNENVITRKDQLDLNAFPYFTIYQPQNVINWSLDKYGNPNWVLLRESEDANQDLENYNKDKRQVCSYRLWTRDEWAKYDEEYNLIETDLHNLGMVPIVCAYDKKSKFARGFLGISSIADIVFIARDVYNSCSELRQILRDQTFAFLAVQGTASEYNELSIGTSKGLLYPEGRNLPAYVSPPADNAEVYFKHIDRQVSKIHQLAKLEGGSASLNHNNAVTQSGVSKAWDFNETNASLADKASNLEDAEMRLWQLYARWLDKEFEGSVHYPKEFSVSSLLEDIAEAEAAAKLELGNTFETEIKKTIQRKKFPRASMETIEAMENDLTTAQGAQAQTNDLINRFNFLRNNRNGLPAGE